MDNKLVVSALALALVFGSAASALAAGKKHTGGEANAAATIQVSDPRANKGGSHEGWCDVDPQCNGWNEWLQDVKSGKLKDK